MSKTTTTTQLQIVAKEATRCWAVGCQQWQAGAIGIVLPNGEMGPFIPLCEVHKPQLQRDLREYHEAAAREAAA